MQQAIQTVMTTLQEDGKQPHDSDGSDAPSTNVPQGRQQGIRPVGEQAGQADLGQAQHKCSTRSSSSRAMSQGQLSTCRDSSCLVVCV
jgi:hypothetical protein